MKNCVKYNGQDSSITDQVMRLKSQFDELVNAYLPKDGVVHSLPPLNSEGSISATEPRSEMGEDHNVSDYSSSDEDYYLTNDYSTIESSQDLSQNTYYGSNEDSTTGTREQASMSEDRPGVAAITQSRVPVGVGDVQRHGEKLAGVEPAPSADGDFYDDLPVISWT